MLALQNEFGSIFYFYERVYEGLVLIFNSLVEFTCELI